MLDPRSWLPQAQALEIGQSRRVQHDCGEGKAMHVRAEAEGWSAFCHRCDDKGWVRRPGLTLAERNALIQRRMNADLAAAVQPAPEPRVYNLDEWPPDAKLFLYRAGLARPDIRRLGSWYHPPTNRVVLPVLGQDGTVLYWQARRLEGSGPKYLGALNRPRDLIPRWGSDPAGPVLTEDILSAFKVGDVSEGWAVLGTSVSDGMLATLMRDRRAVRIALDPDHAGQTKAAAFERQLRRYGVPVSNILLPKDPKLVHRHELRRLLTCPSP